MDKKTARETGILRRDLLDEKTIREKSGLILERLIKMPEFVNAEGYLVYASAKNEVETDGIIKYALSLGKRVYCPKVTDGKNRVMEFLSISDIKDLTAGYFGIREPVLSTDLDERDSSFDGKVLMLMPGVAFDESRNRVGYNGGFYDRYLEKHPRISTLALAFDCQIFEETIETDCYDVKPLAILTESRVIRGE